MKKISINDKIQYDCYIITLTDNIFEAILDCTEIAKVVTDLSNIQTISIYDHDATLSAKTTDFTDYSSITLIKKYFRDETDTYHDAIRVNFKKVELEEKIKKLNIKVDELSGTVNESAMTIDEYKLYKKSQIGDVCRATIYSGTDVETSHGTKHFSYTDDDQANMKVLFDAASKTKVGAPYHADGESCITYTWEDIVNIYVNLQTNLLTQTTYCNALNRLIDRQPSKTEVSKITYGQDLPKDLKEGMDSALEQGRILMNAVLTDCGLENKIVGNL